MAVETAYDRGEPVSETVTLHAEAAQIRKLEPYEDWGFCLKLYGEVFPDTEFTDVVPEFSGSDPAQ